MSRPHRLQALALAGCLATAQAQAQSSLMIWPLDPVIEEDQRAAALWLENRGQQPMSLQIRVLAWSQADRIDGYAPQETVIASPPMAVVPAGQRQLVRLMNTRPAPDGTELAYRVLVDELPNADGAEDGQRQGSAMGIKLQIRYSVPLFVSGKNHWTKPRADKPRDPATAARAELRWRTERGMDGHYLFVRNDGRAHARLTAVQWVRGDSVVTVNPGLLGYVLPGAEMRWKLDQAPPPGHVPQARVNNAEAATAFVAQ
ncbi:fimbrial biogenesis chaperone [Pseudorhodoferax soli]|uniref:Fimbrial chaperone protein n=1 Tax=Pseudorhodoferax soli TaxID=545864 RepID=A0A368XB43_9BURK|nr:molecular chaperone [Pseudorhodoferax soli]RCW65193.1 fimbrial chaperone protein [Pseudorhodoferax soli]